MVKNSLWECKNSSLPQTWLHLNFSLKDRLPAKKIVYPKVLHRDRHVGSHPLGLSLEHCLCYPSHSASDCETSPESNTRGVRQFNSAPCRAVSCSPLLCLTDAVCKLYFRDTSPTNIHKTNKLLCSKSKVIYVKVQSQTKEKQRQTNQNTEEAKCFPEGKQTKQNMQIPD